MRVLRITPILLLLLAMGEAFLVVPRAAGANPNCKPNRAACTTNQQCCSKACIAGLCAASAPTSTSTTISSTTTTTTSSTTTTTMPPLCGNGVLDFDPPEACDDGNQQDETQCEYGTADCTGCSADCSQVLILHGHVCGDGNRDVGHEDCDDGNTCTETECAYGEPSCDVCTASCHTMAGTVSFCGDGFLDGRYETCDDGNTNACGSCSANCKVVQQAEATGLIVPVPFSELADGESFTIDDGLGTTAVFEFDSDANVPAGATAIPLDASPARSHAADKIAEAIDGHATLRVDAVSDGPVVLLTHQVKTSLGNQAIVTSVVSTDFYVTGMSGGAGGDCPTFVQCTSDADCASEQCGAAIAGECD